MSLVVPTALLPFPKYPYKTKNKALKTRSLTFFGTVMSHGTMVVSFMAKKARVMLGFQ